MNYYKARQRDKTKRWDFTRRNDDIILPVGFCAGWHESTPASLAHLDKGVSGALLAEQEKQRPFQKCFHKDGHDTEAEARACFRAYLLDIKLDLKGHVIEPTPKCNVKGCAKGAREVRAGNYHYWYLCETHRTREVVEGLLEPPTEFFGSY